MMNNVCPSLKNLFISKARNSLDFYAASNSLYIPIQRPKKNDEQQDYFNQISFRNDTPRPIKNFRLYLCRHHFALNKSFSLRFQIVFQE